MRFTLKIGFALVVAAVLFHGAASAASFTASLDREAITLGESATLSLTFEGGSAKNMPTPSVPGLQIAQIGGTQRHDGLLVAQRTFKLRPFAIGKIQAQSHGVRHGQDVGK